VTPRDRRALITGAAIVLGGWLSLNVVPRGYAEWRGTRERLMVEKRLLADTRQALKELPRLEDSAKALTARVGALAPRILSGSSAPVALNDLSGRLGTLATLCHGRLLRFESSPDTISAGPLRRVTADVSLETDFRGLTEVLERLQRDPLVTVVKRVRVTAGDPLAPAGVVERLDVELTVSAWYLAREAGK